MFNKSSSAKKINPWGDDHPEKLSDSSGTTIGLNQQIKGLFNPDKILSQVLGRKGEQRVPGKETEKKPAKREATLFLYSQQKEIQRDEQNLKKETEMILSKLKEQINVLEKSEKALAGDLTKIKVERLPQKTGIYYVRYLEWLLTVVKHLRMKVDEGRTWLEAFMTRKKKKMGYWKMYKKHGTTFGLSQERTTATQTG